MKRKNKIIKKGGLLIKPTLAMIAKGIDIFVNNAIIKEIDGYKLKKMTINNDSKKSPTLQENKTSSKKLNIQSQHQQISPFYHTEIDKLEQEISTILVKNQVKDNEVRIQIDTFLDSYKKYYGQSICPGVIYYDKIKKNLYMEMIDKEFETLFDILNKRNIDRIKVISLYIYGFIELINVFNIAHKDYNETNILINLKDTTFFTNDIDGRIYIIDFENSETFNKIDETTEIKFEEFIKTSSKNVFDYLDYLFTINKNIENSKNMITNVSNNYIQFLLTESNTSINNTESVIKYKNMITENVKNFLEARRKKNEENRERFSAFPYVLKQLEFQNNQIIKQLD